MPDSGTEHSSSAGGTIAQGTQAQIPAQGSGARTPVSKPGSHAPGHRTPKRPGAGPSRMRPVLPDKMDQAFRSTPNLAGLLSTPGKQGPSRRRPSLELDLVSDIGDNQAVGGGFIGALPHSFAAHLAKEAIESRHTIEQKVQQELFVKIMMARMNTLEEGFRDVIHEMRGHLRQDDGPGGSRGRVAKAGGRRDRVKDRDTVRPATAAGDIDVATSGPSPTSDAGAFVQPELRATELETGKSELQEALQEARASDRPASH